MPARYLESFNEEWIYAFIVYIANKIPYFSDFTVDKAGDQLGKDLWIAGD